MDEIADQLLDVNYWLSAIPALLVAGIVIYVLYLIDRFVTWLWNNVVQFFAPVNEDGPLDEYNSPSPLYFSLGCIGSSILLIIFLGALGALVFLLMRWFW